MTPEDKAREIVRMLYTKNTGSGEYREAIAQAIREAREEGAREMRERAAFAVESAPLFLQDLKHKAACERDLRIAQTIRNLPLAALLEEKGEK